MLDDDLEEEPDDAIDPPGPATAEPAKIAMSKTVIRTRSDCFLNDISLTKLNGGIIFMGILLRADGGWLRLSAVFQCLKEQWRADSFF
ncbi:hypothetical protein PSSHI_38090 [Photobacterium sp. R1]